MSNGLSKRPRSWSSEASDQTKSKKTDINCEENAKDDIGIPMKTMLLEHNADGKNLKSFLHGILYQQKILLLTFLTGAANEKDFRVATEVKEAGKFDDIVFARRNVDENVNDPRSLEFNFFQAKHCMDVKKKITYKDLIAEETDSKKEPYSLLKYFRSIPKIKRNFKNYTMANFVICSNLELDLPDFQKKEEEKIKKVLTKKRITKKFFFDDNRFIPYKLVVGETDTIWDRLSKGSNMQQIAEVLIEHILLKKNKRKQKLTKSGIFIEFNNHFRLIKNGILVKNGTTVKFDQDFLDGNNDKTKPFYDILQNLCQQKDIDISCLKTESLNVSEPFGEAESQTEDDDLFFADVNNEDIKEFFEKLIFLQTPNEDNLAEILSEHLRDIDSKLHLMDVDFARTFMDEFITNWMKQKSVTYKDKNDGVDLVEELKRKLAVLEFVGLNSRFCEELKRHNVTFKSGEIEKKILEFLNSNVEILHLKTTQTLFSAIRTYHVISAKFQSRDSFIFDKADLLLPQIDDLILAFQSKKAVKLLVIVCGKNEENVFETLKNKLLETVPEKKKIIFITNVADHKFFSFHQSKAVEYFDEIKTDDFSQNSKTVHINKDINFQGNVIPLYTLIGDNTNLIDSETLLKLVLNNEISIGHPIEPFVGFDGSYFPREFFRDIYLSLEFLFNTKFSNDCFILQKMGRYPLFLFSNADELPEWICFSKFESFDEKNDYSRGNTNENLHIVKHTPLLPPGDSQKLIKTYGSISSLVKFGENLLYRELNGPAVNEETLLESCLQEKVLIIADIAGMGKSTVLTSLIMKLKKSDKCFFWVIRINFNYFKNLFKNTENIETEKLIEEMLKHELSNLTKVGESMSTSSCFNKRLFEYYLETGKVVMVFDGYDEIDSKYVESVDNVLKQLQQKNAIIWITTRTQYREKLEELLNVFSYSFKPFEKEEQQLFLESFWKMKYRNVLTESKTKRLHAYAENLFREYLNRSNNNIIVNSDTAIVLKMFAEVFQDSNDDWEGCFSFLDRETEDDPQLPEDLNLFEVYELFTNKKLNIYVKEKDNRVPREIEERHKILAVHLLVSEELLKLLLTVNEIRNLEKFLDDHRIGIYGIIDYTKQKQVYFVHLTFAEFFAAKCIMKKLESRPKAALHCINHILTNASEAFIKFVFHLMKEEEDTFKDYLNGTTLMEYAVQENLPKFVQYLITDANRYLEEDQKKKTALHYAAESGNSKMVIFILSYVYVVNYIVCKLYHRTTSIYFLNFVSYSDENGKTAKDYAAAKNCQGIIKILTAIENFVYKKYPKDKIEETCGKCYYRCGLLDSSKIKLGYIKLLIKLFKRESLKAIKIFYDNIDDENIKNNVFKNISETDTVFDHTYFCKLLSEEDKLEKLIFLAENNGLYSHHSSYDKISHLPHLTQLSVIAVLRKHLQLAANVLKLDEVENHVYCFYYICEYSDYYDNFDEFFNIYRENFPHLIGNLFLSFYKKNIEAKLILYIFDKYISWYDGVHSIKEKRLSEEININITNKNGETPLFLACDRYSCKMIRYLVKHGADVNFANEKGDTPLFMAVRSSNISSFFTKEKVIKYLIKSKADVNATNKDGETPLFAGIISETPETIVLNSPSSLIKILIKNGACVSSKNKNNETPFDVAIQRNVNIYHHKYLMQAGIIYNSAYLVEKRDNFSQNLKALLNYIHDLFLMAEKKKEMNMGAGDIDHLADADEDVDMSSAGEESSAESPPGPSSSTTPRRSSRSLSFVVNSKRENMVDGEIITESLLHVAVRANNLDAVKWLIKNRAHVSAIDSLKNTPEMIAESYHYDEILVHLKEAYHDNILSSDYDYDSLDDSDTSF